MRTQTCLMFSTLVIASLASLARAELIVDHASGAEVQPDETSVGSTDATATNNGVYQDSRNNVGDSREARSEEAEDGVRSVETTRLVKRYRVTRSGDVEVEYDETDEGRVVRSTHRRTSSVYRDRYRNGTHHHRGALDDIALGLAISLPFVAYHNFDRHHRGYRGAGRHHYRRRHH